MEMRGGVKWIRGHSEGGRRGRCVQQGKSGELNSEITFNAKLFLCSLM